MIKLLLNGTTEVPFDITIFPDKTSQVWNLKVPMRHIISTSEFYNIIWDFENEAELIHVIQLATLIKHSFNAHVNLYMDRFPYARQDKAISNVTTFAAWPFINLLHNSKLFSHINTVDMHNPKIVSGSNLFHNELPNKRIQEVLELSETDIVCFPDKGASQRGYVFDEDKYGTGLLLSKKRNQTTGEIEGLKFSNNLAPNLTGLNIMLVDDLGDGMRTFIEAAKLLKSAGANKVFVYTTHGLYTKGTKICFDAGIDRIFNYKEEVLVRT